MGAIIHDDYQILDDLHRLFEVLSCDYRDDFAWRECSDFCDEETHAAFLGPFDDKWRAEVSAAVRERGDGDVLDELSEEHWVCLASVQAAIVSASQAYSSVSFYATREAASRAWNEIAAMKGDEPRALPNDPQGSLSTRVLRPRICST